MMSAALNCRKTGIGLDDGPKINYGRDYQLLFNTVA